MLPTRSSLFVPLRFADYDPQHPDYKEETPPEWLVDVPDPSMAEEWEMLSFYRFVDIDQPEAFANMLQVCSAHQQPTRELAFRLERSQPPAVVALGLLPFVGFVNVSSDVCALPLPFKGPAVDPLFLRCQQDAELAILCAACGGDLCVTRFDVHDPLTTPVWSF